MASQRDIQSLVQNLAGTHTLSQSNVPSGVNNGNPNTVYNNSPWNFSYSNPIDVLPKWSGLSPVLPPTVQPPAPNPNPNPNPGTGGNTPPGNTPRPGGGGSGPGSAWNPGGGNRQGGGNVGPVGRIPLGGTGGTGSPNGWLGVGVPAGVNMRPGDIYAAPNLDWGSMTDGNWKQVLDAVTEVIPGLQGNFYNSQTGTMNWDALAGKLLGIPGMSGWYQEGTKNWDMSNILGSLAQIATGGIPFNWLMNLVGKIGTKLGWSDDNIFVDHYKDNLRNRQANLQGGQGGLPRGWSGAQFNNFMLNLGAQGWQDYADSNGIWTGLGTPTGNVFKGGNLGSWAGSGGGFKRGQFGAGVLTGDAARAFFESMKMGSMGIDQTGADMFGRYYAQ